MVLSLCVGGVARSWFTTLQQLELQCLPMAVGWGYNVFEEVHISKQEGKKNRYFASHTRIRIHHASQEQACYLSSERWQYRWQSNISTLWATCRGDIGQIYMRNAENLPTG